MNILIDYLLQYYCLQNFVLADVIETLLRQDSSALAVCDTCIPADSALMFLLF